MFIRTYKDELINTDSIAYLTAETVRLEPQNVFEETEVVKLVATMKDFTKIILTHFREPSEMWEAQEILANSIKYGDEEFFDFGVLAGRCGSVSDCCTLIGDDDEEGNA